MDKEINQINLIYFIYYMWWIISVEVLTKSKNQEYMEYIENIKSNNIATKVKIIDLKHNMDLTRLSEISDKDLKRNIKYFEAYKRLSESWLYNVFLKIYYNLNSNL